MAQQQSQPHPSRIRASRRTAALRGVPQGELEAVRHATPPSCAATASGCSRTDPRAASRNFAGAVVADGHDADAWIGLARALLAIPADPNKDSERYDLPVNASGAAYIAYERAQGDPQKARALAVLGDALQRRSYWRPAIDALKTSLALADNGAVRETYDKLRAEHGFRMTDYKAEAGSRRPAPVPAVLREPSPAARSTSPSSSPSTARIRRASRPRTSSCASTA